MLSLALAIGAPRVSPPRAGPTLP